MKSKKNFFSLLSNFFESNQKKKKQIEQPNVICDNKCSKIRVYTQQQKKNTTAAEYYEKKTIENSRFVVVDKRMPLCHTHTPTTAIYIHIHIELYNGKFCFSLNLKKMIYIYSFNKQVYIRILMNYRIYNIYKPNFFLFV